MDQLIDEEHTITIDFLASVDGQTWEMFERPKSKFQLRNQLIESMTIKFETDKITLTELLSQLSSICSKKTDLKIFEFENFTGEEEEDEENNENESNGQSTSGNELNCAICFQNQRDTLLIPCNHFKICETCFEIVKDTAKRNKNELLCPFCRQIVTNSTQIFL